MQRILLLLVCLLFAQGCANKQASELYTDPKGRFSVEVPKGWQIQELYEPNRKVIFSQGNDCFTIRVVEYYENSTITETEKNRVRSGMGPAIQARFGGEISDTWEKSIMIDSVEGWVYGLSIPSENLKVKIALFIKDSKFYTIGANCSPEQEKNWNMILSSFKSKTSR